MSDYRLSRSLKEFRESFLKPCRLNGYKPTAKNTPIELDRLINQFDRKIKNKPILNKKNREVYLKKVEAFKLKYFEDHYLNDFNKISKRDAFRVFRGFVYDAKYPEFRLGRSRKKHEERMNFQKTIYSYSYMNFKQSGMSRIFKDYFYHRNDDETILQLKILSQNLSSKIPYHLFSDEVTK